ncbi:MAG: hypothetical protein WCF67_06700 [Chitinophagaceae bacterium]
MMFSLSGKQIIVLSPENWGQLLISKHNYAIALGRGGNKVHFLTLTDTLRSGEISAFDSGFENLTIVRFKPNIPLSLKFRARPLYNFLMKFFMRRMLKKLSVKPDIVWDFNCSYEYPDLSVFGAAHTIYQPVDFIKPDARTKKADIMVTISEKILQQYQRTDTPKLLVSHGISGEYAKLAAQPPVTEQPQRVKAGYIGNLTIDSLDRQLLKRLVAENPEVEFHIIGPLDKKNNNLGIDIKDTEMEELAQFLKTAANVVLYGSRPSAEVSQMISGFDVLLICYKTTSTFQGDNSHKMLEYMASGKLILTTYLSAYDGNELVVMSPAGKNEELPRLFKAAVGNLAHYNSADLQNRRKQVALENTYDKQILKIEDFFRSHVK